MKEWQTYILPILLGLVMIYVAFWIVLPGMQFSQEMNYRTRKVCLENGYPDYQVHGNKGYCIRLVDGNQVVINVDDLEPK